MVCESAAELDIATSVSPPSQEAFVWQFEGKEIKKYINWQFPLVEGRIWDFWTKAEKVES